MPDTARPPDPIAARPSLGQPEFVAMTAALMALNALAIDIMLPALPDMGAYFQLSTENDRQQIIISYMLGFGVAQLVFGPLTDRFGRRKILFLALAIYTAAGAACVLAPDYGWMLAGRVLQGAAAGGTRVIAVSAARDLYAGRQMAKVMSLVMMVFMAAPILAPSLGQALLLVTDWRGIFWALAAFGVVMIIWVLARFAETLPADRRTPLNPRAIAANYMKVMRTREALGYTVASGFLFGALTSFITSSEQLYHDVYDTGDAFPLWFAGAAGAMTLANLANSRLVERLGMRRISHSALIGFAVLSGVHAALAAVGLASFPVFYGLLLATFFTLGLQGPNYNAIAMEPLGRLAGSGAAVIGFSSSFVSAILGGLIASTFDGTSTPIFVGHFLMALGALAAIFLTERGRLFGTGKAQAPSEKN